MTQFSNDNLPFDLGADLVLFAQNIDQAVGSVAGYKLPDSARRAFLTYHKCITGQPPPNFIAAWESDHMAFQRWHAAHIDGVLTHTQGSLSAAYYHRDRILEIERLVMNVLDRYQYQSVLRNSTASLSSTQKWDFEYQAFIMAVRRCLDHLTRAIAAFFQHEFHSFRDMPDQLGKIKKRFPDTAVRLAEIHRHYAPRFTSVLSEGSNKSVRDRIVHKAYVPAAVINLSSRGLLLVGGGEGLNLGESKFLEPDLLSVVINRMLGDLQECLDDLLDTLVDEISRKKL